MSKSVTLILKGGLIVYQLIATLMSKLFIKWPVFLNPCPLISKNPLRRT